jgi:hypothetical protein
MKLASLQIDPEKIETGEWVDDLPGGGDIRIKTKGLNNSAYRALQAKLIAAVPRAERRQGLKPETMKRINTTCLVETCLLDWDNLDGVKFSKAKASELLTDPRYEPLLDICTIAASWVAEGRADDIADAGKN